VAITDHLNEHENIIGQLIVVGDNMGNRDVISITLDSLPKS
jgi:hypothetical protein